MAAGDRRSPPARPTLHDRLGIFSSSPSLPDLRDLAAVKPKPKFQTIRSGSAAVPVPTSAATAFTSASDLLRIARATGDDSFDVIDEPEPTVAKKASAKRVRKTTKEPKAPKEPSVANAAKPKKKRAPKRLAKEIITLSSDGVTPKVTRHEDADAAETAALNHDEAERQETEGTPLKAKPWKKFKATTSPEQSGTGEAEAVSPKPPAKAKAQRKRSKPETVSRHFSKDAESVEPEVPETRQKRPKVVKASTPEPINLEAAVQRRTDWTPVEPDTLVPESSPDPFGIPKDLITNNAGGIGTDATLFRNLRDTYGHTVSDADAAAAPKQQPGQVLGKRKVIEMVSVSSSTKPAETSRAPSPAKAKAPKKKPRTITELATAAYGPQITEESNQEDSVLEYFSVEGAEQDAPSGAAAAKGKGKASKVTKSRKKVPPKKPVLLSPQAAMRQSAAQDFIFGTTSQLAREDSPTFLKDLHAAMQASTIAGVDDPFASPMVGIASRPKPQGKGLWSVSARDEEGELVDVEVIDMIHSPALPQDDAILDPWTQLPPKAARRETETADSSVIEIDARPVATEKREKECSQPPVPKSLFFMTQKMTISAAAALSPRTPEISLPKITDLLDDDEMPPPSNQQQQTQEEEVRDSPSKKAPAAQKPRPKYESFTDAKLAKEISKFGFKAVKTRSGMIVLLDQCWKSKSQASVASGPLAIANALASPKRKRTDAADETLTISPPAKKPRGKAKQPADADTLTTGATKKPRARKGSEVAADAPAVPKKKLGRLRKDATVDDVPVVPKKKLDRPLMVTAVEEQTAASSVPPPPKPKAGPSTPKRKNLATQPAWDDADDLDLEDEIIASDSSPDQLFSPGGTGTDVTISEDTEISLNLSPTVLQATVFSHITKAVRSAPRTTDPEKPSWHEKMLMYDPVILEELTAWLNSGELTKVGFDDEVSPQDVKKWCELRSICCLWKGNWHGKERKRF